MNRYQEAVKNYIERLNGIIAKGKKVIDGDKEITKLELFMTQKSMKVHIEYSDGTEMILPWHTFMQRKLRIL